VVLTPVARFLVFTLTGAICRSFADLDRNVPTDRPPEDVVHLLVDVTDRHGVSFAGAPPTTT
jgi:hypothetical protein